MQRGALGLSLSFSLPSFRPSNPYETHEPRGGIDRGVLPMDVCNHRWIDRTIFIVCYMCVGRITYTYDRFFPVFRTSRCHRDYTGAEGGTEKSPRAPSPLAVGLYSRNPVCIFIYEIVERTEGEGIGMDGLRAVAILSGRRIN